MKMNLVSKVSVSVLDIRNVFFMLMKVKRNVIHPIVT